MKRENGYYWVRYKNDSVNNNWCIIKWNGAMWYDRRSSKDEDLIIDEMEIVREPLNTKQEPKANELLPFVSNNECSEVKLKAFLEYQDTIDIEIYDKMSHEDLIREFKSL